MGLCERFRRCHKQEEAPSDLKQHLFHGVSLPHSCFSCLPITYYVLGIVQGLREIAMDRCSSVFMGLV